MKRIIIYWMILMLEVLALISLPAIAVAQSPTNPYHQEAYSLDSKLHNGRGQQIYVAFQAIVRSSGARWMRLHFNNYNLGQQSYLSVTSLRDGGQQRFDSQSLSQWSNASAVFNGEAVEIKLHVAPEERDIFFQIDQIIVGDPIPDGLVITPQTLCGPDNRVASTDRRVGRIFYSAGDYDCTVWLTSNGALLTAGHCTDFDPDGNGSSLPDGTLDLNGVIEFNVPSSTSSGTVTAANPNDQYPIVTTPANSVVWSYDGEGQGLGKDWAVFRVNPNSNTGLTPYQAQGNFFRMTRANPPGTATIRITGYGVDDTPPGTSGGRNAQNQTNQTNTGTYVGETISGNDIRHEYQVDTMGANSGSPIIWEDNGFTIGIHTNGGCTAESGNSGTSFEHDPLETALQNFRYGTGIVYVDQGFPNSMLPDGVTTRDGTVFRPFLTIAQAINTSGARTVSVVAGSYNEPMTISKALTLTAPAGTVTIGQ